MMRWIWGVVALAIVGLGAYVLVNQNTPASHSGKMPVVAAENFWGNIAAQIGGDHVQVTSIITDPAADPHLYESDARDAAAISASSVVIVNGLGYDDFMQKLLGASPNSERRVITVNQVLGVSGGGANPHLWYDALRVHEVAAGIEAALAAKDPADRATFQANLDQFNTSLQPELDAIKQIKATYPGAPVAYTERVAGYLLADAGLTVKSPAGFAKAIEDGNDPSPADTQAMESLLTSHGVKLLLYNAQATSPVTQHIRDLATQAGIPVVGVTETLPQNESTYQSWMLDETKALQKALGQG